LFDFWNCESGEIKDLLQNPVGDTHDINCPRCNYGMWVDFKSVQYNIFYDCDIKEKKCYECSSYAKCKKPERRIKTCEEWQNEYVKDHKYCKCCGNLFWGVPTQPYCEECDEGPISFEDKEMRNRNLFDCAIWTPPCILKWDEIHTFQTSHNYYYAQWERRPNMITSKFSKFYEKDGVNE